VLNQAVEHAERLVRKINSTKTGGIERELRCQPQPAVVEEHSPSWRIVM